MFKKSMRLLLTVGIGALALGAVPAYAVENDGLTTDFGGFGVGGTVADAPLEINDVALQPDGKVVAVGV